MFHTIFGIDFTSAPRRAKAITVAKASLTANTLHVDSIARLESFTAFEAFLATPGPWVGGFDFPFGLPRELVTALAWPSDWRALNTFLHEAGKSSFKSAIQRVCMSRPYGARYIKRLGDTSASSSSPMNVINPPVGLMFFEGAFRLAGSGVSVIPNAPNDDSRIALEAYPGFLARQITLDSYKKDGADGNSPKRCAARQYMMDSLPLHIEAKYSIKLSVAKNIANDCVSDGSGDLLDALLCAVQAASAVQYRLQGDDRFGIPACADDFEGWIATVPAPPEALARR
jgi:Protein of unknown function (DUF429)